ncbi:MAG: homoserine O-acetyltransferase [Bacteroidales bacterium]|nr:homoserine O-acetyltransferase [Bacteroidales bacterium]MDD2425383.1 homoserine O-acetyltransferase [Bacteroidales bacterium]MDD3988800.1 homoserine O-acetyltransferase [Bacteroidales bacterium]MDD4638990.1 homoserine O-acetyltransferase [Bacteroidales bacterium]
MKRQFYVHNSPFELESGGRLDRMELCYHISKKRRKNEKVIWICHALTANSDPVEWWGDLAGKGKLFDPDKYTVVCVNALGSCYGSTGPTSISPEGKEYLLSFPRVTVRDVVRSQNILREYLGIEKIDLVIGGSVGGFQALEWSLLFPESIENCALIACNARVSPWGTAFNEAQRMALMSDQTFREQKSAEGGKTALAAARAIGLISYRSYSGYAITQSEKDEEALFANRACTYQQYQGKKLCNRFDAYSYYSMLWLTDSHNTGRGRGGVEKALGAVRAKTLIIGIEGDMLFPFPEQVEIHKHIKNSRLEKITSQFGHDGFLLEWKQISNILSDNFEFLKQSDFF